MRDAGAVARLSRLEGEGAIDLAALDERVPAGPKWHVALVPPLFRNMHHLSHCFNGIKCLMRGLLNGY
jgi:hypothetical protein